MAGVLICPPANKSSAALMIFDATNHPGNTPGAIMVKEAGEVLDPSCCCLNCEQCDPGAGVTTLNFTLSGALTGSGTLTRDVCGISGAGDWYYGNLGFVPTDDCGGEFSAIDLCVFCDDALPPKAQLANAGAFCATEFQVDATTYTCNPFSATFEFHTMELFPGGCPCGDGELITLTVTE